MNIDAQTQLCGVLGNPVEHSLSPAIHNAAFQNLGLNFVYLAFCVEDVEHAVQGIRALGNFRGCSVTIPHKIAVMPYLDEIEPTARHIGSVNTIVKDHGRLLGSNTDATGALQALREGGAPLEGHHVLIVGSGGVARAVAFALAVEGGVAGLTILGIDEQERTTLVQDIRSKTSVSVEGGPLTEDALRGSLQSAHILIHGTPVGMHPNVQETCIPNRFLSPQLTVMDIVYNPLETRLLREAREAGCRTIRGVEMFVNQAVGQFERSTGRSAPVNIMRKILEERFA